MANTNVQALELQAELIATVERLEEARGLGEALAADRPDDHNDCNKKIDELNAGHHTELEAANAKSDEAEKRMQELEEESKAEILQLKKTSAGRSYSRHLL